MKEKDFLATDEFHRRTKAGLNWLKRSFDVTKDGGSSAYFTQVWKPFGWQLSYPETTGYIIETLLDYDKYYPEMDLKAYALNAADWICSLKLPNGSLPGGFANSKNPSVFNTGQMMVGLIRAFELTGERKYYNTFQDAARWLVKSLEVDGSWNIGAYKKGYIPSYYTRVIWPVLWANKYLQDQEIEEKMRLALFYYKNRLTSKMSILNWSFNHKQKAFTHTIAYTIRGFYESSVLLQDNEINSLAIQLAEKVLSLRELKGKLAGWYDENWQGDYWFTCLTGNCQMSIIFSRIYQQTSDLRFLNTALKVFDDILEYQDMSKNINKRGALPGSAPIYGRYLAFRYPNWATKFFLDAYNLLRINTKELEKTNDTGSYVRL